MKTSYWISQRLRLGAAGTTGPVAVAIAVAGVALAVMVLEFTLAVVMGFKEGIQDKLMGFDAQITVGAPFTAEGLQDPVLTMTPALDSLIAAQVPLAQVRAAIRQPGMLKSEEDFEGILFVARENKGSFDFERSNIVEGQWPDYAADSTANSIVISRSMARALKVGVGDRLYAPFIIDGAVKIRRPSVAGIYESNFGEYDRTVAYASMNMLRSVNALTDNQATRLEISGLPLQDVAPVSSTLQDHLVQAAATGRMDRYYPVDNVLRTGAQYFNWMALLDTNVTVIYILMLLVTACTLVSSLFILVLERIPMIGVLRALGADKQRIRRIFADLGFRLVLRGIVIGNILGISLLLLQKYTHALPLNPDMYYLSSVPVSIHVPAFVLLNIGIAVVAYAILLIPAAAAAATDPSKAIAAQ